MTDINNVNLLDCIKLDDLEKNKIIDQEITIAKLFKNYNKVISSSFHIEANTLINNFLKDDDSLSLDSIMMIYSSAIDLYFKENKLDTKNKKEINFLIEIIDMKSAYLSINFNKNDINKNLNFIKSCLKISKENNETDIFSFYLPPFLQRTYKEVSERLKIAKENFSKNEEEAALNLIDEIQKIKYEIIEFGFFKEMRKYTYHTEEEIINNKVSNADKLKYFNKMPLLSFIKVHMREEIENFTSSWKTNQDFSDIIVYEENDNSLIAIVNKNNLKSRHFAHDFIHVMKLLEIDGIEQYQLIPLNDGIKMIFTMVSDNNKNKEANRFKELLNDVSNIVIEEKLGYMTNDEMTEITINFNNSLREINLLSQFTNNDTIKKKNKI